MIALYGLVMCLDEPTSRQRSHAAGLAPTQHFQIVRRQERLSYFICGKSLPYLQKLYCLNCRLGVVVSVALGDRTFMCDFIHILCMLIDITYHKIK